MSLETLANELLFDAFEYLSCADLFDAFNGLNSRFDSLIIEYFRSHRHIDFRLILKEDLNIIRRRYLQLFINEIQSIYLSDDNTTPHEIDLFISRIHPLYRFQNLQSISLFNIYSLDKINRILHDLRNIPTLTELNFKQCYVQYDPKTILSMMNSIWSLSNLTNCCLDIYFNDNYHLITPSVISCSIKHLSISGFQCDLDSFSHLYEHTPYVEYLSLTLWDPYEDHHQLCLLPSITELKLKCDSSSRIIQALLRKMPNLTSLTVETKKLSIDGNLWKDIINKYFPKLTIFNLKMEFQLATNDDIEQEIDRIIGSFQDQFWIDQHRWFIRCFCYTENDTTTIHLHTLPYVLDYFSIAIGDNFLFKSTVPQDKHCFKYNYVENFEYNRVLSEDINLPYIQFPNVKNLTLTLPCDDHIKFLIPRFYNLLSLNIKMINMNHHDNDLIQIQTLLDQAPTLYYLKFDSWISATSKFESKNKNNPNKAVWKMPPYSNRSSSVRYIYLRGVDQFGQSQYYNDQQCLSLIRSPLGSQCQHLVIEVEKRTNIIDLVTKMNDLRTLNVRCRDRKKNDDDLIKWLQTRLPSKCSFAKDSKFSNDIRMWIR